METNIFKSEREQREALREIYFETGAGLFDCQRFEYGLKVMIYMLSQQKLWQYDFAAAARIIEGRSRRTLGQLIDILKKEDFLDADIEKTLSDGLDARNNLAHNFLIDNVERMAFEPERKNMAQEIRAMRRAIRDADKAIGKVVEGMTQYLILMSIDVEDLQRKADAMIHASPTED